MGARIRVLHLEDEPSDSELVELALRDAGMEWDVVRVESRDAFVTALTTSDVDIVVSDYRLPSFDGLEALRETRARRPELAFVFFTATLGEERAVEALKAGATDFVVKTGPGMQRLVPALRRAVEEARERRARKQAEGALREREASFRLLFDTNPLPMWVFDRESLRFLEVNEAAVDHYGYSRDEFLAMRITDIRPAEDADRVEAAARGEAPAVRYSGPWRHELKDGRVIDVEVAAHDLEFRGRPGRLVVAHDVSDRKLLEAQLLQSQKMEAIGQLAGGVAHDFNNLLSVISGCSELLLRKLPPDAPARERVEQIRRAADRGAALTRQLLAFGRKQVLEPKVLDLNGVLAEVQSMLRRLIGEDIRLVNSPGLPLGRVKADPGQMEQVLLNLAVNARDAMPRGGTLVLETGNVDLDDAYARTHHGASPGPHVRLAVSDTGQGMDAQTISRIFEPFFTTKPRGKGTGLGLATVYGIVKQSGGHVDVYSEPGRGSTFKIYLPRVDGGDAAPDAGRPENDASPGGSETILLVEDEESVRALLREFLEEGGYSVLEASAPESGLLAARSHPGPIHLLLTDVIMPQMSGGELAARLRSTRPDVKVLYVSGYTDQAIGHHGVISAGTHFLQKPFTLPALLRKLRVVLDGPDQPQET